MRSEEWGLDFCFLRIFYYSRFFFLKKKRIYFFYYKLNTTPHSSHLTFVVRPVLNFFRKKKNRERKKFSRCFGFSFFFAVLNIFYKYRTIENFYAHHIIIFKYKLEKVYPIFLAFEYIRRISIKYFWDSIFFTIKSRCNICNWIMGSYWRSPTPTPAAAAV